MPEIQVPMPARPLRRSEKRRAVRYVASVAQDVAELREFLAMLGLEAKAGKS